MVGHFILCVLIGKETMQYFSYNPFIVTLSSIKSFFANILPYLLIGESSNPSSDTISQSVDKPKNVNITINEVNMVIRRLGMRNEFEASEREAVDEDEIEDMFKEEEPSLEEIWEAFKVFDVNKDGFIDAVELSRVLYKMGLIKEGSNNVERCKLMIKEFDRNGDGMLDFNEFLQFMETCLS